MEFDDEKNERVVADAIEDAMVECNAIEMWATHKEEVAACREVGSDHVRCAEMPSPRSSMNMYSERGRTGFHASVYQIPCRSYCLQPSHSLALTRFATNSLAAYREDEDCILHTAYVCFASA